MKTDINLQTKVANLLEDYPDLENKLTELSPVFSKLRNPILRRTIAKVATLKQAAEAANISPPVFIRELRIAAGLSEIELEADSNNTEEVPQWFNKDLISISYDASSIIAEGKSPMQEILKLSTQLEDGKIMQLITPFKPSPIIDIMKSRGFTSWHKNNNTFFYKV